MGLLTRERQKFIYLVDEDEPITTYSKIRRDKVGWYWFRDREKIMTINPARIQYIVEMLTDTEKPI
jgi:hypothetical protein